MSSFINKFFNAVVLHPMHVLLEVIASFLFGVTLFVGLLLFVLAVVLQVNKRTVSLFPSLSSFSSVCFFCLCTAETHCAQLGQDCRVGTRGSAAQEQPGTKH